MLRQRLYLIVIILFLVLNALFAEDNVYYFVNENLKLREDQDLSNATITIMPAGTQLELIESGYYEVIDGIRDQWQKVRMKDGTEGWCFGGYLAEFIVSDGILRYCSGKNSTLNIPDNLGITSIGEKLFLKNDTIREVTIPDGVLKIGDYAFQESSIEQVNLPEGLIEIGNEVFYKCWRLKTMVLPQSLERIGDGAFRLNSIESINIPPRLTHLGNKVFDVSKIKSIFLPSSVISIGRSAFLSETLQEILVDDTNPIYTSREGVLFTKDMTTLVAYPPGAVNEIYRVPDSITHILSSAFGRCQITSEIILPEGLNEISSSAFWAAESLKSINIPPGTTLGELAFKSCENLIDVSLPPEMQEIPDGAFSNCKSLQTIILPDKLKYIGEGAFGGCLSLKEVYIPNNVKIIGAAAFAYCVNLTKVNFGSNNTSIESVLNKIFSTTTPVSIFGGAFENCTSLETVTFPHNTNFRHGSGYGYKVFENCTALKKIYLSRKIEQRGAFEDCAAQVIFTD